MLTVVCFKWFDPNGRYNKRFVYTADYVNRLARMVRRNLTVPHEFVCVTDDASGLDGSIRPVPIEMDLILQAGQRYPKLMIFRPDAAELLGPRMLMLDLDTVVVGSLDTLVSRPEPLVLWQDPGWKQFADLGQYNTSMVLLTANAHPKVWTTFERSDRSDRFSETNRRHSDQAWIFHLLGAGLPVWTAADGVLSFRYNIMRKAWFTREDRPYRRTRLPRGARIVFLHSGYDPAKPKFQERHRWARENWR